MKLTVERARDLVRESDSPGARWPTHSEKVAEVALQLARAGQDCGLGVDVDFVEAAALVHDIGRARSQHPSLHGLEGYLMLVNRGYAKAARVCLTHVLKGRTLEEAVAEGLLAQSYIVGICPDDLSVMSVEEQIVATADAIVIDVRVVPLHVRYAASKAKYAGSAWMSGNENRAYKMAANLETLFGQTLSTVVVELTSPK